MRCALPRQVPTHLQQECCNQWAGFGIVTAALKHASNLIDIITQSQEPYTDTIAVVQALQYASLLGGPAVRRRASRSLVLMLLQPHGLRCVLSVLLEGVLQGLLCPCAYVMGCMFIRQKIFFSA